MKLNSVSRLVALASPVSLFSLPNAPSLCDLDWDEREVGSAPPPPHFDARSRIFELDSCGGNGKVCLVYNNCAAGLVAQHSEFWFLDRALGWHFLTSSFTSYFRLMITHLGLPEWQSNFTPYGPSPQAKQWAWLYQPLTFAGPQGPSSEPHQNLLDPSRAFRTKTKTPPKKKPSTQSGTSGTGKTGAARGSGGSKR